MILVKRYLLILMVIVLTIALFYAIYRHTDGIGIFGITTGILFFSFIIYNQVYVETFKLGSN